MGRKNVISFSTKAASVFGNLTILKSKLNENQYILHVIGVTFKIVIKFCSNVILVAASAKS